MTGCLDRSCPNHCKGLIGLDAGPGGLDRLLFFSPLLGRGLPAGIHLEQFFDALKQSSLGWLRPSEFVSRQ